MKIFELCLKETGKEYSGKNITRAGDVLALLEGIRLSDREHFVVIPLDVRNRPLGLVTVHTGRINRVDIRPADVFKPAILLNALSVILAHNHPSGDVTPSEGDRAATKGLVKAGEILGLQVLDHIIVSPVVNEYFSFKDEGGLV